MNVLDEIEAAMDWIDLVVAVIDDNKLSDSEKIIKLKELREAVED